MTLSRWRRIATGIAAGVIVLCAALLGSALRSDNAGVSVASELRPEVVIPIEEDPAETTAEVEVDTGNDDNTDITGDTGDADDTDTEEVDASADDAPSTDSETATAEPDTAAPSDGGEADDAGDDEPLTEPVPVGGTDTDDATDAEPESPAAEEPATDSDTADPPAADTPALDTPADPPAAAPVTPAAPVDGLGTGGGVDDAECALDRLVIYAGARIGGVAGSIRAALAQAGFAAGCAAPVTVLASNCPLQFSGVLGAGSGYDPNNSYVAASPAVDRETMTAVMGTVGYSGSQIDILDFGFVVADQPGEQWMAIFIPPSFDGWQNLANRAGLSPTATSLCSPSGQLNG